MLRKTLIAIGLLLGLLTAYLFFWPVPVDPIAWTPGEAPPLEGVFAVNDALASAEVWSLEGEGAEDVAVDAAGLVYGGLDDGRIVRLGHDGSGQALFADTGGRPLGLHFDAAGNLIVADADRGLLSVSSDGVVTVLTTECDGRPFLFTDDLDIAPDGTIYFSDASDTWDHFHFREDIMESRPHGRLLAYEPATQTTRLVVDELHFANGVAVSPDGRFVLVNETARYRVMRHWLEGERAGETEVFIENLPGFPDGISAGTNGVFWLPLFSPRSAQLDAMLPKPWLRRLVYRLPRFLQPDAVRHGVVLGLSASGEVIHNLQHEGEDSFSPITSAQEHLGMLYLGSLSYPGVARIPVPQ